MAMIKRLVDVVIDNRKQVIFMLSNLIKKGSKHIDENGRFVFKEDSPAWVLIDNGDGEIEDVKVLSFEYDKDKNVFKFYTENDDDDDEFVTNDECLNLSEENVYDEFASIIEDELG